MVPSLASILTTEVPSGNTTGMPFVSSKTVVHTVGTCSDADLGYYQMQACLGRLPLELEGYSLLE